MSVCCVNKPGGCSLTGLNFLASNISSDFHFEKTNSGQHSTLSNLMSKRLKQVSLFFDAVHSVEEFFSARVPSSS